MESTEKLLYFHPALANTMRLIPMNFGFSNRTIVQSDRRESLQLSPVSSAESPLEMMKIANAVTDSNDLNSSDLTDEFERLFQGHPRRLATAPRSRKWQR
jgi:hypothetical protein